MNSKTTNPKLRILAVAALNIVLILALVVSASAATVASGTGTWISGKLTYTWAANSNGTKANGATGTVSVSNSTLTVTATNSKFVDGGCSADTAAEATTTTVTVTNASSYPLKINTLTVGGSASVAGVSQGDTIASGATFTISVTAPATDNSTKISGTVTIAVEEKNKVDITLVASPYVTYTVDGHAVAQNGSDVTFEANVNSSISLPSVTAPSGYTFVGWRIGSSITTASSFTASGAYTVYPVIVESGTPTTGANFKVGSATYTFWEEAVSAAVSGDGKLFVNAEEVVLPTSVENNLLPPSGGTYVKPTTSGGVEYTLPSGVTMVVPYDTSTTIHTTTPAYGCKARVAPYAFRTLTVSDGVSITVNGAISVDSYVCAYGQGSGVDKGNGTPSGPHGKIVMKSGSEMTFNYGASLYCYGYINGDGMIYMKNGAKVYELFQFCDWRGGTATSNIEGNTNRVFPMNQYYVQNVEAPMRLYKGSTEYVWSVVNMSSKAYPTNQIEFIGSNGMFKLSGENDDYITKRYHANVDQLEIAAHGNMTLNALNVTISGLPLIGSIEMKSADYVLPINNMNIVIETGMTSISSSQTYGISFLPSSKLTVNEGATFSVNAPVYLYDADDWGPYCYGSVKLWTSAYSTANGTTNIRTADNLKDAEMNVNGTVTVSNKLYTTEHGANITSSNGTGVISFTTACATGTATTYQATQSGSDISYTAITVNNAWLQNGDESYSYTVGTGTSTWHYDKPGEHWYRFLVDFKFNGNLIQRDFYCENNDTVTYDASWLTNLGATASNGTAAISGSTVNVTGVTANSTVTLTGTPAEYIPTFVLSEEEYTKHYQFYNPGSTLPSTTISDETYYIVAQADSALAVGTSYDAPTDASMGVSAENHNSIVWNLSGLSYTSGNPYQGSVPAGETAQGPSYIYGFYDGVVAYNSWNDTYYKTLYDAFIVLPQDASATITLLADCGTFEEESGTIAFATYTANNITLDLNGYHAVGRIVNAGTFTLELNGGTFDFHTGATVQAATWKGLAAIINNGTLTIQDSVGGGVVKSDACSPSSGADGSAVIRNNKGATLTITGKDADHFVTILENQTEVAYNSSYGYYAYNYGIYNLGHITELTNVDITTAHSRTTSVNVYNYNTGVIDLITGGHMYAYSGSSIFNYGGTITTITGLTIDGKNGVTNRNIRTGSQAAGWTVAEADKGVIDLIDNCDIEVGQYAIYNHAVINKISSCTLVGQPDSAQVDTRGDGLETALDGNIQAYTVYNSYEWWYNTNVWKQVDSSAAPWTRVNYYKEEEQYRPHIGQIIDCEIYAKNTTASASYGQYALLNYGVIDKIGGETTIKAIKHPDNAKSVNCYYALVNSTGGIIKSIEGTVNTSAYIGAVYNSGVFTKESRITYGNKVGGNVTYQETDYGDPSTILSVTCEGQWYCTSYYALFNQGYIQTINAPGLTLNSGTSGYYVLYNTYDTPTKSLDYFTCEYTDVATANTAYRRTAGYTKNLEKGCVIDTLNGVTIQGKYYVLANGGHIGTLSNVTVSTNTTSNDPTFLNGAADTSFGRYASITEDRKNVASYAEDYPKVTISAGYATRYDREYTCVPATIDVIDNLTLTSTGQYALRNMGAIGTLKNSTITATTSYALHNSDYGPLTEKTTVQYYSGTSMWATTKYTSDIIKHYLRDPATIGTIDNCTIQTNTAAYAAYNAGQIGTIKNSTFQAGTTTAAAYALANMGSRIREYTRDLETGLYVTANGGTACTSYWGSNGESNVTVTDYDAPTIDLIGEGNTFTATTTVIANTGTITEIDSGEGTLTTITGSNAKGKTIYNYSAGLDARTTTTPYTAAETLPASGTKGTAVNDDTLLSGAMIGTIKNVYIDANGYGIMNGDGTTATAMPTIGEIGEGTEIYAHCTTAGYHAIANQNYAEITRITGGIFRVTAGNSSTPTNAYRNGYNVEGNAEHATVISGGYFQGMPNDRNNAIFKPDNTDRQTYAAGKNLSTNPTTPTPVQTDTMTGSYYYIADAYTVTFDMQGHGTAPDAQSVVYGGKATEPTPAPTDEGWTFGGWYKEDTLETEWNFSTDTVTANTTLYAKWTKDSCTVTLIVTINGEPVELEAQNGVTMEEPVILPQNGQHIEGWYKEDGTEWNFETDTVNSDTTLTAHWAPNTGTMEIAFELPYNETEEDMIEPDDVSYIYAYGTGLTEPESTYYSFGGWQFDGDDHVYTTQEVEERLQAALETKTGETLPAVTAVFTRNTYYVDMYSWINPWDDELYTTDVTTVDGLLGRTMLISTPAIFNDPDSGDTFYFQYWLVGLDTLPNPTEPIKDDVKGPLAGEGYIKLETCKAAFFPDADVSGLRYKAIAYYTMDPPDHSVTNDGVSLRIVNEAQENAGEKWRASVTIEVMGPKNGYTLTEMGLIYQVTANGATPTDDNWNSRSNDIVKEKVKSGSKAGGTYTVRQTLDKSEQFHVCAYAIYEKNGVTKYVYYANGVMNEASGRLETPTAYRTISYSAS